jgi:hypothetical protein
MYSKNLGILPYSCSPGNGVCREEINKSTLGLGLHNNKEITQKNYPTENSLVMGFWSSIK